MAIRHCSQRGLSNRRGYTERKRAEVALLEAVALQCAIQRRNCVTSRYNRVPKRNLERLKWLLSWH
jgi:hypothetical protein